MTEEPKPEPTSTIPNVPVVLPPALPTIRDSKDPLVIAEMFHKARVWPDLASMAQAFVKIQAGKELGIAPFAAMNAFNIIKGKIVMSGNGIAALIDRHPDFDYSVLQLDDKGCKIEFFRDGVLRGTYTFGEEDARKAGLLKGDNYQKYPRAMYFNRCLSAGYKAFIPGATMGIPVYSEGELEDDTASFERENIPPVVEVVETPTGLRPRDVLLQGLQKANISVQEFAQSLGVSPQTIEEADPKTARNLCSLLAARLQIAPSHP